MSDLSRERCKNLAGWGLPQRVGRGSWIYWITTELDPILWGKRLLVGVEPLISIELERAGLDWVLDPDLEELMKFAWTLRPSKTFALVWESDTWAVVRTWDRKRAISKQISPSDVDVKQAVYKLIEKHFEKVEDE